MVIPVRNESENVRPLVDEIRAALDGKFEYEVIYIDDGSDDDTVARLAYDPQAMAEARRIYGEREDLILCESPEHAIAGADALAVVTEWKIFRSPDFDALKNLKERAIFDGRNLYDPGWMAREGFVYYAIGR